MANVSSLTKVMVMYVVSSVKVAAILYKTNFVSAVLLTEIIGAIHGISDVILT